MSLSPESSKAMALDIITNPNKYKVDREAKIASSINQLAKNKVKAQGKQFVKEFDEAVARGYGSNRNMGD